MLNILKRKKIYFAALSLLLVPFLANAAFNDLTATAGSSILLPGNGLSYDLTSATRVESFTVNTNSIEFTMKDSSIVELQSTDRSELAYSSGCEVIGKTCTDTLSTLAMLCRTDVTLTITPGAAGSCSGGSAGSTSGGGGFSGGSTTQKTTTPEENTATTVTINLNDPFTLDLSASSHTVTITSATDEKVEFTIASDPLDVVLNKDETKDLDTDGDGLADLRVTYYGFSSSSNKPRLKFIELSGEDAVEVDKEASTCLLQEREAFKQANSSAVYYITKDCKKRAFNNSRVFFTYFDSWGDVNVVDKSTLDSLADDDLGFMPWGPKYDPKYGALVKVVTDPKVYLLLGTEKYWITSEDVFGQLGYYWGWIEDIDQRLLDNYTTGSEINYTNRHPDHTLVKYEDDPKVYKLEGGKKRHIKDEDSFNSLNYRWDRIVVISGLEEYEDGDELSSVE